MTKRTEAPAAKLSSTWDEGSLSVRSSVARSAVMTWPEATPGWIGPICAVATICKDRATIAPRIQIFMMMAFACQDFHCSQALTIGRWRFGSGLGGWQGDL